MKTALLASSAVINLETIRLKQLAKKISELVKSNLHIIDKTRSLTSILKGPAFNEVIEVSMNCVEHTSEALVQYNRFIYALENQKPMLSEISIIDDYNYSGWVDRTKELIQWHTTAKEQIIALIGQYDEIENRDLFLFLKQQYEFHKNQIHQLRNCIEG